METILIQTTTVKSMCPHSRVELIYHIPEVPCPWSTTPSATVPRLLSSPWDNHVYFWKQLRDKTFKKALRMLERWLRKHTTFPEDLTSVPSRYISGLIIAFNSSSQRLDASSLQGHEYICTYPYTDTCIHTVKNSKSISLKKKIEKAWGLERWLSSKEH